MNKQVVLTAPKTIEIVETPIPEPPPKGMIVKVTYAGVCHSDAHFYEDKYRINDEEVVSFGPSGANLLNLPRVLGHELAGEVYAIGNEPCPGDPDLKIGDRVAIYGFPGCELDCGPCHAGERNQCVQGLASAYGLCRNGGMQNYLTVKLRNEDAIKLPANMGLDLACTMGCSALTTYAAVQMTKPVVEEGARFIDHPRVLVIGAGGLGMWALQWVKALLPKGTKLFVADVKAEKIEAAKTRGADGGVLWPMNGDVDKVAALTKEQCGGELDASMDFVGSTFTTGVAFNCSRINGIQVLIGLAGGTLPIPITPALIRMVRIRGVVGGSPAEMKEVIRLVSEGKVIPPPLQYFKPEQAAEVIEMLIDGKMEGRGILDFSK